ncbi:VOC family protein [Rhodococcoides fascians]|uniref:VOC family protein n=1 Tax=Rhodococcoides fascians TaxID=1828 RepID=UPI002ACD2B29|nr:VOC family protein [Rhodococcus fascians]WQH28805.1 VOC family protein [Rhodococcus fascians]
MSAIKVGHVALTVTDLEESLKHYTEVIGLVVTERNSSSAYLRAPGDQDSHCIAMRQDDSARLEAIALKMSHIDDLAELEAAAGNAGATITRVSAGERFGIGEAVEFGLPSGHVIRAYHEAEHVGWLEGMLNPHPVASDVTAGSMHALRMDHIAIGAPDTADVHKFLTEVLDFQSSEILYGPDEKPMGAWMTCGGTLHDIAITPGGPGAFHHAAFAAPSQGGLISGVDLLKHRDVPTVDYGLTRHGIGGVNTVYFYDPSGHRNELFADPYVSVGAPGKVPEVSWNMETFSRGAFYFENELDMAFMGQTT